MTAPRTIVFDVNETLSDLAALAPRFTEVGAPTALLPTWFAGTLRDGMALTLAGGTRPFAEVARAVLTGLLTGVDGLDRDPAGAAEHVLAGFGDLPVHPDVAAGVRALAADGHRLVTLSNGAAAVADALLRRAGVRDAFAALLTVEDVGVWKPHPDAYRHAAQQLDVPASELLLVAVHPWDLHGAARAGLATAYVDRTGTPWPEVFDRPDHTVPALTDLADRLWVDDGGRGPRG